MRADPPLITLRGAAIAFGGKRLFADAELSVTPGMRA